MRHILYLLAALIFTSCSISFSDEVRKSTGDDFMRHCNLEFVDIQHFDYHDATPSIVFLYLDEVNHCHKQAKVFNEAAALYSNEIHFWAINANEARLLSDKFGHSGKFPVFIFINQNLAQSIAIDDITLTQLQECISKHFGIVYLPTH